uniref:Uncharacterized protein n=1 Tax=Solanum tuberosum TaxID=4113 RepID=M1DVP0_SOLTU
MNEWDRLICPCCSTWHGPAAARRILAEALDWNNTAVRLLYVAFGTGVKTPFLLCLSLLLEKKQIWVSLELKKWAGSGVLRMGLRKWIKLGIGGMGMGMGWVVG